jgi:hypothetical protein
MHATCSVCYTDLTPDTEAFLSGCFHRSALTSSLLPWLACDLHIQCCNNAIICTQILHVLCLRVDIQAAFPPFPLSQWFRPAYNHLPTV